MPERLWIYVPFGDLQCCFYIESALLRIKSSSTKVLKFQLSVLNKLESAGCFGFLHFIFQYVSGALTLKQYWELMQVIFFIFHLGSWPASYSWADRNVRLSSSWCHSIQLNCKNDQNISFCFKNEVSLIVTALYKSALGRPDRQPCVYIFIGWILLSTTQWLQIGLGCLTFLLQWTWKLLKRVNHFYTCLKLCSSFFIPAFLNFKCRHFGLRLKMLEIVI